MPRKETVDALFELKEMKKEYREKTLNMRLVEPKKALDTIPTSKKSYRGDNEKKESALRCW